MCIRDRFVAATNPAIFADGLTKALATIARRTSSSSNIATNAATIKTGGKAVSYTPLDVYKRQELRYQ